MIGYIISFTIGSFFGMFIMALASIAKQSDKKTEELMRESAGLFYTPNYKTLLEDKILKEQIRRFQDVL